MRKNVLILVATVITLTGCEDYIQPDSNIVQKVSAAKQLGNKATRKGDYFKALNHYYQALESYRELDDPLQIYKVTSNIGVVYSKAGYYSMALSFYQNALEQRKALGDIEGIAKLYYRMGIAHALNTQTDESRIYLNLADSIFSTLRNEKYTVRILNELGKTYESDGNYVEAKKYYTNALSLETDKSMSGLLLKNIGYTYHLEDNDDQALVYYRKAQKLQDHLRPDVRTRLFQNLGQIHQDQDSLVWYYARGFDKDLIWINDLYLATTNTLYNYHHAKSNLDSTKYYYELEHQAALKLRNQRDELKRLYDQYQVKYAHYKEQARQQAAILEKEQFQKLLINSVISGVLLLSIIFIGYRYRAATGRASTTLKNN